MSKHDVKGAFLNARIPEGRIVVVAPPPQWEEWGLVPQGVTWTLEKAVYGLRESPYLWGVERDARLSELRWTVGKKTYRLNRCSSDSQLWTIIEDVPNKGKVLGLLIVYVDDFLLQTYEGGIRDGLLAQMKGVWTLAKEEILTVDHPITFLGLDIALRANGDVYLSQDQFVRGLLDKYGMTQCKGNQCVQVEKLPETVEVPTPAVLKQLQSYSGEFNWLATRTRPDVSYFASLLASSCTKYATWSLELASKVVRYLAGTRGMGILITAAGSLEELVAWSDAGYAGADTKSQSEWVDHHLGWQHYCVEIL